MCPCPGFSRSVATFWCAITGKLTYFSASQLKEDENETQKGVHLFKKQLIKSDCFVWGYLGHFAYCCGFVTRVQRAVLGGLIKQLHTKKKCWIVLSCGSLATCSQHCDSDSGQHDTRAGSQKKMEQYLQSSRFPSVIMLGAFVEFPPPSHAVWKVTSTEEVKKAMPLGGFSWNPSHSLTKSVPALAHRTCWFYRSGRKLPAHLPSAMSFCHQQIAALVLHN